MEEIIKLLHEGGYSCVIRNEEIRTFTQRGVADLYDLLNQDPAFLKGAQIADKVIGKAAAALMVLGGVQQIYTDLISEPALTVLRRAGIPVDCVQVVPRIQNRTKTGWCPMETICYEVDTAEDMFPLIRDFVETMRAKKQ
mgnify:CR=1 FL=1|jgi:hypothetical protein